MAEQKKLKLGDVAMLDKNKIIHGLIENKNFNTKVFQPFCDLVKDFLNDFSNELKNQKETYSYPNLIYLTMWASKKSVKKLEKKFESDQIRLGRGLIFHICPSNVPTNFIYSFFFGLLSGNSNIVKIPSKKFREKEIILLTIKSLFKKKKFFILKNSNCFIEYKNEIETTKKISSICDGRVIWGGDKTINEIRKVWIPERTIEITFSDRYSLSIININQLKKKKTNEIKILANRFFYDGYTMNQLACNSPHFVFWVGKRNTNVQNYFWSELNKVVEKKFLFDEIHVVDKYTNLIENVINQKNFRNIKTFKNNLYIVDPSQDVKKIENFRGVSGTFFQKNINQINGLKNFISKKCQTGSYFGFSKKQLELFILNNNLLGIDRLVPIGKALGIDIIWDGYEVLKSLSRSVSLE